MFPFWLGRITITYLAFWDADFHKMKSRKTLSISHNVFNTTDDDTGLTESFSASAEW
jgi:hypothetical protein